MRGLRGSILLVLGVFLFVVFLYYLVLVLYSGPAHRGVSGDYLDMYRVDLFMASENNHVNEGILEGISFINENESVLLNVTEISLENNADFIRHFNKAIASNVDGIIVQGTDHPTSVQAINKAVLKGIPVHTILSDSPSSLREMYVGPNHYSEGRIIGEQIVNDLQEAFPGESEIELGFIYGLEMDDSTSIRRRGVLDVLRQESRIKVLEGRVGERGSIFNEEVRGLMNDYPSNRIFLGFTDEAVKNIYAEITKRSTPEKYSIYAFDLSHQTTPFLKSGLIKAAIKQESVEIGSKSMDYILSRIERRKDETSEFQYTKIELITGEEDDEL